MYPDTTLVSSVRLDKRRGGGATKQQAALESERRGNQQAQPAHIPWRSHQAWISRSRPNCGQSYRHQQQQRCIRNQFLERSPKSGNGAQEPSLWCSQDLEPGSLKVVVGNCSPSARNQLKAAAANHRPVTRNLTKALEQASAPAQSASLEPNVANMPNTSHEALEIKQTVTRVLSSLTIRPPSNHDEVVAQPLASRPVGHLRRLVQMNENLIGELRSCADVSSKPKPSVPRHQVYAMEDTYSDTESIASAETTAELAAIRQAGPNVKCWNCEELGIMIGVVTLQFRFWILRSKVCWIRELIQPIFFGEAIRLGYPVAGLIVARATGISSNNAA
ncbi:hypothetical protein ACLKA6_017774 [Drosophila palustris]